MHDSIPVRLAAAALAAAASPLALGHPRLVASSPADGQVLDAPPIEVKLSFNEHVDPRHARVKLVSSDKKRFDADRARADKTDPNSIDLSVPVLRSGTWRANWTALGADGRKARGEIVFTIR